MDIGIHFLNFTNPGGDEVIAPLLAQTAKVADDAGFALFTVMDHFFQMDRVWPADEPMLEAYSALSFAAAHTSRIRLSALVTGVTYRYPGVLAKTVTTLDVLSGGRAMFGIGAGWYEREHLGLGVPFPPVAERFERLEETLQICRQMWSDDDGQYSGTHYTLAETLNRPRPLSGSYLPILIGGNGERKTLRLVARYADVCNFTVNEVEDVRRKIEVLKQHCDRESRDFATIRITVQNPIDPIQDPDGFLRRASEYAALGVHHVHLRVRQPDPVGFVERTAESVQARLAEIEPSR